MQFHYLYAAGVFHFRSTFCVSTSILVHRWSSWRAPLWGFAAGDLSATFRQNQGGKIAGTGSEIEKLVKRSWNLSLLSLSHMQENYRRKGFARHHISVLKLPNQFLSGPQWWLLAVWLLHWVRGLGCDLPLKASRICCRKVNGVKHFNWWRRQEAERCQSKSKRETLLSPTYAVLCITS